MRHFETKIPNPEQTGWDRSGLRFLLYPMGIFFFGLFKVKAVAEGARVDTVPSVNGFPSLQCPTGGPQTGGEVCAGRFSTQSDVPLEPFSLQVPLRRCQGFTCWHGDQLLPSDTVCERKAEGAFVACVTGRGQGSNGETPIEEGPQTAVCQGTEECLSHFRRKKTNKQTKRSKEKGKKGNHGAFSKEPKTAISASRRVGKFSFVLMKGYEAYLDQLKKKKKEAIH